jgi:hypothetical protein
LSISAFFFHAGWTLWTLTSDILYLPLIIGVRGLFRSAGRDFRRIIINSPRPTTLDIGFARRVDAASPASRRLALSALDMRGC